MVRSAGRLRDQPWASRVEIAEADATDAQQTRKALDGVEVAYYLIHTMGGGSDFADADRRAATTFAAAAREAGVARIVYLGGLAPNEKLSPHLRSRVEVGEIFLDSGVPAVVLRAAVIIGSGSASFEMLRYLTERLPVMTTPRWVRTRTQPIAIRDVLRYLVAWASVEKEVNRSFDIGGPDVLTYADMMTVYAEVAGLPRRVIIPVPMLSPGLSSHWVGLVTPVPAGLARPLVESLRNEAVCREHDVADYVKDPPGGLIGLREAVELALRRIKEAKVLTRWSSASTPGTPSDPLPTDPDWAGGSLYVDARARRVKASPQALWTVIEAIGGEKGWYSLPSPGTSAASSTGSSAAWDCAADAAIPGGCGWVTPSTSGGWRRSSQDACCACARRCACPASRGWNCGCSGTGARPSTASARSSTHAVWRAISTGGR